MGHVRQQIREQAALALQSVPLVLRNVFQSRVYPLSEDELPAILITTDGEQIEPNTISGLLERNVLLTLAIKAKAFNDLDDTLDTISESIEKAMANDTSLSLKNALLSEVEVALSGDGDQPIGTCTLRADSKRPGI